MRIHRRLFGSLFVAAALSVAATPLLSASEMLPPTTSTITAQTTAPAAARVAERPSWHSLPLTDARTGQTFTLADFDGKTVYVEPMATWCTNCRQQMSVIRDQLRAQVDPERVVFVGLSVETTLASETLASYAVTHGFDWTFAVMTPELLQELASTFGRTVTNPPAVPHFVIGPDGTTGDLSTGHHSADRLLERLAAAGGTAQP
jgi:cytochrome oxidase Cu insertion factor (SCO1/SenC/PrrC family)